jgi:pimeloyl-[acyl-carrier protein] methyl ester esterase
MTSFWIHGWASDSRVFEPLLAALAPAVAANARLVDLPGANNLNHGQDADTGYADHIRRLIEQESSRGPLLLAGWSMGAMAALEAATMAAGRVSALVLISGCARFVRSADNPGGQDPRAVRTMKHRLGRGSSKVVEQFQDSIFAEGEENMRDSFISGRGKQYQKIPAEILAHGLDYLMKADIRQILQEITCPVLLVHGNRDTVIDLGLAKLLADSLPDARLHVLDNAGHAPLLSRTEETAATIAEFIAERQG